MLSLRWFMTYSQPAPLFIERQGARVVATRPDIVLMRQRALRCYGKVPDAVING